MKKIYIALAVLATAALSSCVQEKSFNDVKVGENGLVFTIEDVSTRAVEGISPVEKGVKFELEADEDGQKLFLEETIQDLNGFFPETKGTPAYTENVGVLYADNLSVYGDKGSFTTATTYENMDDSTVDGGWRYYHNYSGDPWPESGAVGFYLNMPASPGGLTINSRTGGKFSISFTSPTSAEDQEDILFAYRSIDKDTYIQTYRKNGLPVLFNHALTGVKFAIANYDADKKITIKSVSFKGLVGTATCEITPASEDNYKDNKTNYSSATPSVVKWTIPETPDRSKTYSSGAFGTPVDFKKKSDGGGSFDSMGDYPDSFAAAGNEQNLNDEDASQTFWFIPQAMSDAVKLTIVYTYGSTTEQTWEIDFGKVLAAKNVIWKAGELRTYTIKLDDVNVKIEDEVSSTEKKNIKITNTGNTDAFIRAAIVGQWLDGNGNPVFGFTDEVFNYYEVASWYQDQFVSTAPGTHGTFVGLAGYKGGNNPLNNWFYNSTDGFYYYTKVVKPGEATGQNGNDHDPLFTKYTVGAAPNVSIGGQVVYAVTFELEIATQAVTAIQLDGTPYVNWYDAWKNALGYDPR